MLAISRVKDETNSVDMHEVFHESFKNAILDSGHGFI